MNNLKKLLFVSAISVLPLKSASQTYFLTRDKTPSQRGIECYVSSMGDSTTIQFEKFFQIKLLNPPDFESDNLSQYTNYFPGELGYYFEGGEIIINNEEKFIGYSKSTANKKQLKKYSQTNAFVHGTLIHEIAHHYFYEISRFRGISNNHIILSMLPESEIFAKNFIEEGFAEYCAISMNEVKLPQELFKPKNKQELLDTSNLYNSKYLYAAEFVKPILDKHGLEKGLNIILGNKLPNYSEILNPEEYYQKLDTISPLKEMYEYKKLLREEYEK